MTKSGCRRARDIHRKECKSEATRIFQDKNHSGEGSRKNPGSTAKLVKTNSDVDRGRVEIEKTKPGEGGQKETSATGAREEEVEKEEIQTGDAKEQKEKACGRKRNVQCKATRKGPEKQPVVKDWLLKKQKEVKHDKVGEDSRYPSTSGENRELNRTEPKGEKQGTTKEVQQDIRLVFSTQGDVYLPAEEEDRLTKKTRKETVKQNVQPATRRIEEDRKPLELKTEEQKGEKEFQTDIRTIFVKQDMRTEEKTAQQCQGSTELKDKAKVDIRNGLDTDILAHHWMSLTRGDFRTLQGKEYLNDKIIDSYIRLIQERSEANPSLPAVHGLTTFFHTQLSLFGLEEGSRRTKGWIKVDLREKDLIFCPVHKQDHWTLVGIEIATKTIHYFDSIVGSRKKSPAPGLFKKYMEAYYQEQGEEVKFKIRIRTDAPTQRNGVDCGAFLCQYAERMSRKGALDFSQEHIPLARKRMTEELLNGKLDPEHGKRRNPEQSSRKRKTKNIVKGNKGRRSKQGAKSEGVSTCDKAGDKEKDGRKEKVKWPKANSTAWEQWDKDMTDILKTQSTTPESKAVLHPLIIYTMGKDKFGTMETGKRKQREPVGPTRRQRKCKRIREEINKLKENYKNAKEEEKEGIKQLQEDKLRELRLAKRAESLKKNRKRYTKNCNAFLSHPFDFAREVIAPKPKGKLSSSKEETEDFLEKAHSKDKKDSEIPAEFHQYGPPTSEFDDSLPTWKEFNDRLQKARNKSAPGPNGVPYLVYKKCPGLARLLFGYLKGLWRKNSISKTWREAEGVFIPKEEGAKELNEFRTISLLNVEGKLFFAMKAERLLRYALANNYIDTSVQKGGVPDVSGCMEHTSVISQLIREAKANKTDLVVTWLDIANAYGSMPHSLIMTALQNTHVPERMQELVKSYYGEVKVRFSTTEFTTDWQRVEKGIITGCTLSVILFVLAMTMLVEEAKRETKGPKTSSGQQ